jgi:hypothetical protein
VAALREQGAGGSVIACVGVLERLPGFARVVHALVALATERQVTIVLALPNDAAAGRDRRPAAQRLGRRRGGRAARPAARLTTSPCNLLALRGAALVPPTAPADLSVAFGGGTGPRHPPVSSSPSAPRAQRLQGAAAVAAADLTAERAVTRARTAELEVLRARLAALDARPQLAPANGGQPPEAEA